MTNSSSSGNEPDAGGSEATVHLSPRQISELFPFHFAFDAQQRFTQVGRSLAKICPEAVPGADVRTPFLIERPSTSGDWQGLGDSPGQLFILRHRIKSQLRLRGQMMVLRDQGCTLFLCSPWLPEAGAMRALGLKIDDFPVHDSMPEFLQVVQAQSHALDDLRTLTDRLRKQREALKETNAQLAIRERESYRLSMIAARTINAVVISDVNGRIEWVNESFERLTGYSLAEVKGRKPGSFLQGPDTDPRAVEYMRTQLQAGGEFQVELANYTKGGKRYWISIEAKPIPGIDGKIEGYMAIETDLTARKEWELRSELAYRVTKVIAEATEVETALPRILGKICGALGAQCATIWRVDATGTELACWHQWRVPELEGTAFDVATREMRFTRGSGMPGLVWQTMSPQVIDDLSGDPSCARAAAAVAEGLHSGFAVPVEIGGQVHGVMEFFSRRPEQPSAMLMSTISGLGNQIGRFVEGCESEWQRGQALALLDSTIESTSEGILVTDMAGNPIRFNQKWAELWSLPARLRENHDRESLFAWIDPQIVDSAIRARDRAGLFRDVNRASDDLIRLADGRTLQVLSTPHRMGARVVGRVWIYRDISRSFAEQEERDGLLATLNATLEATRDGILVTDLDQKIVTHNKRFLEMWRLGSIGEQDRNPGTLRALVSAQLSDPDEFHRRIQWFYGRPEEAGSDVIHFLDGRVYERDTQPQRAGTRVIGRLWSYRDVTERWRAEAVMRESEERYRVVAETASDGILTLDQDYRIAYANAAAHRIFACPEDSLRGTTIFDWTPDDLRGAYRRILGRLMARNPGLVKSEGIELTAQRADGARIPVEVSYGESRTSGRRVFTAILRDISARKAAEKQLIAAMREADSANRAKGDFLANISHEIRTPLNAVLGLTELLRSTKLDLNQKEMLDSVALGAESLLHLISDLLDFSKIESGQVDIDSAPFDPLDVVEQAVEMLRVRVEEKGLRLYVVPQGDRFRVRGDANRIRQILINLISNAIKFTDEGTIVVRLRMALTPDGQADLDLAVEDTGIGIPADAQAHVFQKFFRVDSPAVRRAGGAGLGLSISRLLSEAMGGTLQLESAEGHGSRFSFRVTLPVTEMFAGQQSVLDLLLLTAPERASLTGEVLASAGYSVRSFTNVAEALRYANGTEGRAVLVIDEASDPPAEQVRQLARLCSIEGVARTLRLAGPGSATAAVDGLPGRSGVLEFPLTPARIGRALARLYVEEEVAREPRDQVSPASPSSRGPSSRILLVEDNAAGQDYATRLLKKDGHSVVAAGSVAAAISAAMQEPFDLILMDIMLPDGNGFDASRAIRAHEQQAGWPRSPIVALTAHAMQAYREQAFAAGMDDYLSKPFRPQALLDMVTRWGRPTQVRTETVETVVVDMDLADLVPGFLAATRQHSEEIIIAAKTGAFAQAARLAHNLKGTGTSYGFAEITRAGAAMEEAARSGAGAELERQASTLLNWLLRLRWTAEQR